jgi:hypothetical protein
MNVRGTAIHSVAFRRRSVHIPVLDRKTRGDVPLILGASFVRLYIMAPVL